jgi:uncharacterized membrane protein
MAMRLQELHPSLVHFPIALLPTSLVADSLGRLTGSKALMEVGRRMMPVAAVSAAVAGVAGLIAQESSHVKKEAHPYLATHRNLNLGVIGLTALMAQKRVRRRRPSLGYLLVGLAGLATVTYTAYLGGHMVYEHGVGVKPAGGLRENQAPQLTRENAAEAVDLSRKHVRHGWNHAMKHLEKGEIAPMLSGGGSGGASGADS